MAAEKNKLVHKVLKVLCSGKKYEWMPEELVKEMNTRLKKYSIHSVNFACDVLKKDTQLIKQ